MAVDKWISICKNIFFYQNVKLLTAINIIQATNNQLQAAF